MAFEATRLKEAFIRGITKGFASFVWMMKILIPVSFITVLLQWTGLLKLLEPVIQPMMSLVGLPAIAALPLLSGMLTGVYGGIAAMAVLPFTREQMTLMAIFILIVHNMIQEGVIQAKSGIHPIKTTLFRIAAGTSTVMIVSMFFGQQAVDLTMAQQAQSAAESFRVMIEDWCFTTLHLTVKIFFIIMLILVTLEIVKALDWIDHIVMAFSPVLRLLGLERRVGVLWITAALFGLAYGGAVIVEEAKRGDLTKKDLEMLHLSIGINHSMIEDPTLFLALGLSPFWLWVPRFIAAVIAVRLLRLWHAWAGTLIINKI
jgi:hypothetical protein